MGAGAWDALAVADGSIAGPSARRGAWLVPQPAKPGAYWGKTRCRSPHRVRDDGQCRFQSRMVDRARIAIAVLITRHSLSRKSRSLTRRTPFDASSTGFRAFARSFVLLAARRRIDDCAAGRTCQERSAASTRLDRYRQHVRRAGILGKAGELRNSADRRMRDRGRFW